MLKVAILIGAGVVIALGSVGIFLGLRNWFSGTWSAVTTSVTSAFSSFSFSKWFGGFSGAMPTEYADSIFNSVQTAESYGTMRLREEKQRQAGLAATREAHNARIASASARTDTLRVEAARLKAEREAEEACLADPDVHQLQLPEESDAERRERIRSMEEMDALLEEAPQRQARLDRMTEQVRGMIIETEQGREAVRQAGCSVQAAAEALDGEISRLRDNITQGFAEAKAAAVAAKEEVKTEDAQLRADLYAQLGQQGITPPRDAGDTRVVDADVSPPPLPDDTGELAQQLQRTEEKIDRLTARLVQQGRISPKSAVMIAALDGQVALDTAATPSLEPQSSSQSTQPLFTAVEEGAAPDTRGQISPTPPSG